MDQKTYVKRFMLWTGVILAVIMLIVNLCTFKVVEATAFEEIAKRVVMCLGLLGGYELFAGVIFGPLFYHIKYDKLK